jgi:hypothetical protein
MRTRTTLPTLLAGLVLLAGCRDEPLPVDPSSASEGSRNVSAAVPMRQGPREINADFVQLVQQVPGFGGLFIDRTSDPSGVVTVYLTNPELAAAARVSIAAFLSRIGKDQWSTKATSGLRVLQGQYDFVQLTHWYGQVISKVPVRGFTMGDIDERRNRIVIGVRDIAVRERVLADVAALGIPSGAVLVEEVGPTIMNQSVEPIEPPPPSFETLFDPVRPVIGGLQIQSVFDLKFCTFGFNVQRYNPDGTLDSRRYFMTNSHCTSIFGYALQHEMGQPDATQPIGFEVLDPLLFDSSKNSNCPPGRECRYSDAALFQLYGHVTWDFARIAHVDQNLTIIGTRTMNGEAYALMGEIANKVGIASGFSSGEVTATCADVPQFLLREGQFEDTGRTMLCQRKARYSTQQGDSGSPVYLFYTNGYRDAVGINWGTDIRDKQAVFSSLNWTFWEFDQATASGGSGSRYLASQSNLSNRF